MAADSCVTVLACGKTRGSISPAGITMLALAVHDTQGKRMLTIGPSTPLPQKEMAKYIRLMKPGERVDIEYNLNIFSPELPPGKYSVTMQEIPSNRVYIRIRKGLLPF